MAELTTTKLNAESHLLLDQPLLRMPYELSRKNFKNAQRIVERERDFILSNLKSTASAALSSASISSSSPSPALANLDTMISRMQGLKRKLETLHTEELAIHKHARARLQHLQDLYEIPSLADVKYDEWSRVRLNRLLVDYLLRSGYGESAVLLAREKGIEDLVDVEAFVSCHRIEKSLRMGRTQEALGWCGDNKQALKKMNSNLEFELRLQQYIELVRSCNTQKLMEATMHARKYLAPHQDTNFTIRAAGLLAYSPDTEAEPYRSLYSAERWEFLSNLFVKTHNELFSLPSRPLLHIALSAGLSALKTPSCHSQYASSSSNANSSTTTVCPICSTELNELARNVPYAHHTKSYVENDPVVLPNGRIYGRDRLLQVNEKIGTPPGKIRDPTDMGQLYDESEIKKVFIS
ncbi:macrophage erythroblast attacher [Lepidopterella palustris CBS 459.81]|uniref:Macrophage erythroblast attacher n=1 Tax=Lepidopterella palustris CBS 459.81 TaxID=1314670 RepID=A0A8E2E7I3_9PEZI|nr:macrophage erythroblast attacher [Lepidopterella palustris CBS 459.81]